MAGNPGYAQMADNIATRTAQQYGIDPAYFKSLFHAQINQESGFNPNARSGAGAQGIAQIVPKWHPGVDPYNPRQALSYAAKWDAQNFKKYGNAQDVLSVYNSGRPWSVGQGIGETNNYVNSIVNSAWGTPKPPKLPKGASPGLGGLNPKPYPGGIPGEFGKGGQNTQMIFSLLNNAMTAVGNKPLPSPVWFPPTTGPGGGLGPLRPAKTTSNGIGSPLVGSVGAPKGLKLVTLPPSLVSGGSGQMNAPAASQAASLAQKFGVKISSGYRDEARNKAAGGAGNSDHLSGNAADFIGSPQALRALYAYANSHGYAYVEPWAQAKDHVHISFYRGVKA